MGSDYRSIKDLAEVKQKELLELHAQSLHALEDQLHAKESELRELQGMFDQLKQDFKYNLQLLHERDAELEQQDPVISDLKLTVGKQSSEISELRIRIEQLKDALSQEMLAKQELSRTLLHRMELLHCEQDNLLRKKDAVLEQAKQEAAVAGRDYERQLALLQEELQSERHASDKRCDELTRQLQQDHEQQNEEISCNALAVQLQAKMLTKELEIAADARKRAEDEKKELQASLQEAKKKIKDLEWQIEDGHAELAFSVKSLQGSLRNAETQFGLQREEFLRKISELDRQNSEKVAIINTLKQTRDSSNSELQARLYEVSEKLAMSEARLSKAQESLACVTGEKDKDIQSLTEQLEDLRHVHARELDQLNHVNASDKAELQRLRNSNETLLKEAESRKCDLERYRKDLIAAVDRATQLEREKAQMNIDWQRQAETLERSRIHETERLVASLTKAKDDALATVRRQEEQMTAMRRVVASRQLQHPSNLSQEPPAADDAEGTALREQNESLRLVIRQMRQEMEALVQQVDLPRHQGTPRMAQATALPSHVPYDDYTKSLEDEVKHLKAVNRQLQVPSLPLQEPVPSEGIRNDNNAMSLHVQALNESIGQLRSEKVTLQAQARKLQIRVDTLMAELEKLRKEPTKKQVLVEQLQYELNACERRHATEVSSLQQRIASLELQVAEVQREADEYYKSMLEKNAQLTALENQLAEMKLDHGQSGEARRINYGAQELVIQQLQDEVTRLRDRLAGRDQPGVGHDAAEQPHNTPEKQPALMSELRVAHKQIDRLNKEKAILTELSNKLRAELKKAGAALLQPSWSGRSAGVAHADRGKQTSTEHLQLGEVTSRVEDRLRMMEKLQYKQTINELSRSPRRAEPEPWLAMAEDLLSTGEDIQTNKDSGRYSKEMVPERDKPRADGISVVASAQTPAYGSSSARSVQGEVNQSSSAAGGTGAAAAAVAGPQQPPSDDSQLYSSSSLGDGGSSLQDVWKMLDQSSSFAETPAAPLDSPRAETKFRTAVPGSRESMPRFKDGEVAVVGSRAVPWVRKSSAPNTQMPSRRRNDGQKAAAAGRGRPKIRNYNVKD